jgi:uncharacterized protein (DUF58 family)
MKSRSPESRLSKFTRKIDSYPSKIDKKRVYILPTGPGIIFLFVIFVIFLGSLNENNNMGLLFSFFLFSIFIISIWETRNNLLNLKVLSTNIENTFAGSRSKLKILINTDNKKKEMLNFACFNSDNLIELIEDGKSKNAELYIEADKRGVYDAPVVVISSEYPLGIFRSWSYIIPDKKQIIYPKPASKGYSIFNFKDQGIEDEDLLKKDEKEEIFDGLREYIKGDSIKRISWKSYSKGMGLYVKEFDSESGLNDEVMILWDKIKSDNTENKLSIICKTILEFEASGIKYGIKIPGYKILPSSGTSHMNKILEILAGYND